MPKRCDRKSSIIVTRKKEGLPPKFLRNMILKSIVCPIKCPFFLSTIPFCLGVLAHEDYPFFLAKGIELKIKVILGLMRPSSFTIDSKLILNHCDRLNKSRTNLKFVLQ